MYNLHVDSLTKSFGKNNLLTDIYLSCNTGEILGLLGLNGTGKSTLLKVIFGQCKADFKYVKIGSKRLENLTDSLHLIGLLPDKNFLPNHVKINKLISLFCEEKDQEKILAHSFINGFLHKYSNQLSGGEKRLIEILLILYSKNQFILLDEPFKGVDPIHKEEIKYLIKEESNKKGIIITDHDHRTVIELSNKLIVLKDGGIRYIKNISEIEFYGFWI